MRLATGNGDIAVKPPVAIGSRDIADKPPLYLHRFGCVAHKFIPEKQRMDAKTGARSRKCMILEYVHNTTKIWKLWDPGQMKVTQCSDIKFDGATNFHTEGRPLVNEKECSVFRRKGELHFHQYHQRCKDTHHQQSNTRLTRPSLLQNTHLTRSYLYRNRKDWNRRDRNRRGWNRRIWNG